MLETPDPPSPPPPGTTAVSPSSSLVLAAASQPWAFTQAHPLDTSEFCKEADKRRISLREKQLPDLWRVGIVAPFVEIRNKPLHEPMPPSVAEPLSGGTWLTELRLARDTGRLADAEELGFRPQLKFFRSSRSARTSRGWNGLLYSRWQLLWLSRLGGILRQGQWRRDGDRLKWRCPAVSDGTRDQAAAARRLTAILTALEARYLPVVQQHWISLTNADVEEWEQFETNFDPAATLDRLQVEPDELLRSADNLLLSLHRTDPLGGIWSELVRRAPRRSWRDLSGDALVAMDHRIAAEILLRCYEDLVESGSCAPLDERRDVFNFERDRLSYRSQPLDANLSTLGISPHPGVVLVVEGETEEMLVPLVRDHIRIPARPELIQSVVMRGTRKDLTKLAAFASAPLVDRHQAGAWLVAKPPTRLVVVVDPDPPFHSAKSVEAERQKILSEIVAVVRAQGVDPNREDIDDLVTVKTWSEPCFEFEHFTDEELAAVLLDLHPHCGGLDQARLRSALAAHRRGRQDIKEAWKNWRPRVQKPDLARRLWPILENKLDQAMADAARPLPAVAAALVEAYHEAARRPAGHFVLRGASLSYVEDFFDSTEGDAVPDSATPAGVPVIAHAGDGPETTHRDGGSDRAS